MSKICSNCGAEMPDESLFCTNCGTRLPEQPTPVNNDPKTTTDDVFGVAPAAPGAEYTKQPEPEAVPEPAPSPMPYTTSYGGPAPLPYADPAETKVVSTAAFFWLSFLYCIPVIGLIAAIVLACSAKNLNIRHHASAWLVSLLVGIVIVILIVILTFVAFARLGISYHDLIEHYQYYYPYY